MLVRQLVSPALVGIGLVVVTAQPVMAQDVSIEAIQVIDTASAVTLAPMAVAAVRAETAILTEIPTVEVSVGKRRAWFLPIHVFSVAVQGLDAHSTFQVLTNRSLETDALSRPVTGGKVAFVAVKAGMAAAVVYATHQISKRHPVAAILTAAAVNSVYLTVAANNYKSARAMEARFGR